MDYKNQHLGHLATHLPETFVQKVTNIDSAEELRKLKLKTVDADRRTLIDARLDNLYRASIS